MQTISEDKRRLLSNFFSLGTLQGLNMILPLITLPYLVRVLGVENFGLVNFAVSIIMYFNILVSFGFELSATREISINRDNTEKISEIFSSVMIIKTIMATISFFILFFLVTLVDVLHENYILYFVTFGVVIGNVLFPSWFFHGMERMKYITYINIVSRIIFTICIFLLVQEKEDFIYVPILNSLGAIVGGIYSLWLIFKMFDVKLYLPNKSVISFQMKDSYHFFLSRVANNGSRYFATTIIGLYFGNVIVGYYVMVEKLFYTFMSVPGIVSQTIYPYMSRTKNIVFIEKIIFLACVASIILIVPVMYFNEELLAFVFGVQDEMLSNMFLIIFSGAVFGVVSTLLGYPLLAAFGYVKYANNSLIYASIIYMLYILMTVNFIKDIYLISFSIPVYMLVGMLFRLYYVYTNKVAFRGDYA